MEKVFSLYFGLGVVWARHKVRVRVRGVWVRVRVGARGSSYGWVWSGLVFS